MTGIFCTNGEVSDVVLDCVEAVGDREIAVVGVDGTSAQQTAVNTGDEIGFVAQNPYETGYQTVMLALRTAFGDSAQSGSESQIEVQWIDRENLSDFEGTGYLM